MKNIFVLFLLLVSNFSFGQSITVKVNSKVDFFWNDTIIIISKSGGPHWLMPCKALRADSAITSNDTIYLRKGSSFIIDSLSTGWGGFTIFADSGSSIDLNNKAATVFCKKGCNLVDTSNVISINYYSSVLFDYTSVSKINPCSTLKISENSIRNEIFVFNNPNSWIVSIKSLYENSYWSLFSINGVKLLDGKVYEDKIEIKSELFSPGIYIFQLKNDLGLSTIKLIK